MNILVLGSGAREHSMVYALARSPSVHQIIACPGNVGMSSTAICKRVPFRDNAELVRLCKDKVALAVVGSSKFVEDGTVDALVLAGIPVIGPAEDAGRIETSKAFAAKFMSRHHIPSPRTHIVVNAAEIEAAFARDPGIRVVKCDGFSHGAGVVVAETLEEAKDSAINFLKRHGAPLILQERLEGVECSYTVLTDGQQWVSFSSCRDYKRADDGETGPTTGGMGAVSPSPDLTPELDRKIIDSIVDPVVQGMKADNLLYRGFLSIQLMLTPQGPRVLEFNARLGDPETQSILTRFRGDLAGLLKDCAMGCLTSVGSEVAFGRHAAVSVVVAREGYPDEEAEDPVVRGFDRVRDSLVFFSNCRRSDETEDYRFKSGRLISVTAVGETLDEARDKCYKDIARLELERVKYRRDIGLIGQ
ncbi:MAG: phosphoribosylamine--glycine ligase [Candidatus Riflebacteria bacterium GWC2_50_8]|nr:MAG: phosphoribosylamine--glycine ligase [Candidatus Riflebacteria bacterium GWC2_50_8]